MNIKLISLHLSDFKGVHDFSVELDGSNAVITGANGVGKSTIATAFLWLLTGKDAAGRDNYEIFPLNEDGSRVTGCTPTVTAVIEACGSPKTITRKMSAKYTKRAGSATAVYAGDETKCTIDDVPTAITKFNAWVTTALCPAELLPLLLNASYFSEQTKDYRQRRELLMRQFGAISEAEILAGAPQLTALREAMGRHSVAEMRQILTTQRKAHSDALKAIPARIDELRRQIIPDLPDLDTLRHKRGALEVSIAKLKKEQRNLSAANVAAEAQREKVQAQQEIKLLKTQKATLLAVAGQDNKVAQREKLAKLDARRMDDEARARSLRQTLNSVAEAAAGYEEKVAQLRKDWVRRNAETAQIEDTCPCCGQPLPLEQVQRAVEAWNLQKSQDLDRIIRDANELKAGAEKLRADEEKARVMADAADAAAECSRKAYAQAQAEEIPVDARAIPAVEEITAQIKKLEESMVTIEQKIVDSETVAESSATEIKAKITELQEASDTISQDMARIEVAQLSTARIEELEREQRSTLAALEKVEMLLALCSEYTAVMIEHLTEQVNQHFKSVAFRLFEVQKNGGLHEICEAAVNGVPYGSLNTASKMQANVEIVEAFAKASGCRLPLFLDNRESVTQVNASPDMQIINLQVAEGQPLLCTKI